MPFFIEIRQDPRMGGNRDGHEDGADPWSSEDDGRLLPAA